MPGSFYLPKLKGAASSDDAALVGESRLLIQYYDLLIRFGITTTSAVVLARSSAYSFLRTVCAKERAPSVTFRSPSTCFSYTG